MKYFELIEIILEMWDIFKVNMWKFEGKIYYFITLRPCSYDRAPKFSKLLLMNINKVKPFIWIFKFSLVFLLGHPVQLIAKMMTGATKMNNVIANMINVVAKTMTAIILMTLNTTITKMMGAVAEMLNVNAKKII